MVKVQVNMMDELQQSNKLGLNEWSNKSVRQIGWYRGDFLRP
ncbi:hypothetical protein [Psychrobacillus sp.]|nr:hypothetical protein [Psychrobacillus sp.]